MDALQLFDHWVAHEAAKPRDPLKPESTHAYATVWNAWCRFLAGKTLQTPEGERTMTWADASAVEVRQFLQVRDGQHAAHNPGRQLSEVTRRRYWRLLERIYAYAGHQGLVARNPTIDLVEVDTPAVTPQLGHMLPSALWQRLPEHFPQGDSLYEVRDRAILQLLYDLALAPEEIRAMRPEHLLRDTSAPLGTVATPMALQIEGKRKAQTRKIYLPSPSRRALQAWLSLRSLHGPSAAAPWLFCSNRGAQLSTVTLFNCVSNVVVLASASSTLEQQGWQPKRVGPQVIRNTAIVYWLNHGTPVHEVVQRVGLKNAKGLYHLRHYLNPEIRLGYRLLAQERQALNHVFCAAHIQRPCWRDIATQPVRASAIRMPL